MRQNHRNSYNTGSIGESKNNNFSLGGKKQILDDLGGTLSIQGQLQGLP